ncbi:hypothetical protein JCM8115_000944 [Rhodotorula mucilaginosa]
MHASGEPAAAAPHSASSTSLPPSNGTRPNQDADGGGEGDERELPVVLQDLVPLSYLIDRVVSSAYSDLATLVETLPGSHSHASAPSSAAGTDDQARKRKIVDHVLNSRRQLVKLLVLARWSKEAHRLHKAINIVGFLAIQNHQIDRAIEALTETHGMLARARVRNYDLASALNVLSTGSAASLPASLTDPFAAELAHPLTDTQVLDTLAELDRVLLARLVLRIEPLPPALSDPAAWRIHDGRVTFRVDGMWEADLTFGGDNESEESTGQQGGEWYLLAIRFLFRVKDARGAWSSTPLGPIKDHLLQLCNQELLRRPYFPPPLPPRPTFAFDPNSSSATTGGAGRETSTTAAAPLLPDPQAPPPAPGEMPVLFPNGDSSAAPNGVIMGGEENQSEQERVRQEWDEKEREWQREKDEVIKKRKRDRPLDRGYTFLQRLALSYQLEAVHSSAARLAATSWSGTLEVERRTSKTTTAGAGNAEVEGEDEVRIHYWRPPAAISSSAATTASGKPLRPTSTPAPSNSTAAQQGPPAQPGRRAGPGGTLVFSLRPIAPAAVIAGGGGPRRGGISRLRGERARQDALQAALDRAARSASASASSFGSGAGDDDDLEDAVSASQTLPARIDVPKTLSVTWLPSTSNSAAASIPSALASLNLTSLLGSDLDVERVLRHVTALHARDVIERLSKVILAAPTPGSGDEAKKHGRQPRSRLVYPSSRRRRRRPGGLAGSDTKNKEDEEEDPVDVVVPYLHLPLVGAHAIGAHIDPLTGRFDLRAAPAIAPDAANLEGRVDLADDEDGGATAEADGGSSARDQRLRLASERIDRERFGPAVVGVPKGVKQQQQQQQQGDPDAWMKGLVEVVARIRASTIIDELDTLLSLLSLPLSSAPVRRLPLPPRELAKLGPNVSAAAGRAALLFVPLLADEPALAGWFLVLELFEDGIRAALLSTAERSDQLGNWTEILEVGWLGTPSPAAAATSEGVEAKSGLKGANLGFEIKSEVLRSLWWHCVRRAAAFSLELQLHLRRIPYRCESVSSAATASRLILPTATLLRIPDVEQLLRPDAELRCAVEADGGRKTILLVYLRITQGAPSPLPPPDELPPSVLYNPARGALVLLAEGSLADTVERLLRALATVLKLVRLARPLGSPAKALSASARLKTVK